jgi:hypothetical protein
MDVSMFDFRQQQSRQYVQRMHTGYVHLPTLQIPHQIKYSL